MNKKAFGVWVIMALMASCNKQDEQLPGGSTDDNDGVEVRFSSGISTSVSFTESYNTRAVVTTTLPGNTNLGIYGIQAVTGGDTASYNMKNINAITFQENLNNASYTVLPDGADSYGNQSLYNPNKAKFPRGDNAALAFYAYYPYSSNASVQENLGMSVPWTLNKDDMSKTDDYMYTGQIFSGVSKIPINLKLKHAMARLDFTFFTETPSVMLQLPYLTKIEVKALCALSGWMSLETGQLSYKNAPVALLYPLTPSLIQTDNTEVFASFLLPPKAVVTDIIYTVQDKFGTNGYTVYSANTDPAISLAAGKTTKINVNYFPKDVSLQSSVKAWEEFKSYDIKVNLKN